MSVHDADHETALGELVRFRQEFHGCLTARADALFELAEAVLCTEGPVRSLVGLSLAPEHRRGHGALYDGINHGPVDFTRLRNLVAAQRLPKTTDGRITLAVGRDAVATPRRQHLTAAVVLPHLRPGQGPASDDPRLAVLGRGRPGDWPHLMDRAAGRGPPGTWR
jgi:DDE superfamily endonuclease